MQVVYAREEFPTTVTKSVMLCGPSPRDKDTESWRKEAIQILENFKFDGVVFYPEPKDIHFEDYKDKDIWTAQVEWETEALNRADVILFWVPRDMKTLPGLTTNIEWGIWADSGKCVLGYPESCHGMRYLQWMAENKKIPASNTLFDTIESAIVKLGHGALRKDLEVKIPLGVWKHKTFQKWYKSHVRIGNRIEDAKVLWTFKVGPNKDIVFAFAVHAKVFIKKEQRLKENEFLIGRSNISMAVLYRGQEVVLVREFRTPVCNDVGFVFDLPGGSSHKEDEDPRTVIAHEIEEEIGLKMEPERLQEVSNRQMVSTFSAHSAYLFAAELTQEEMQFLKDDHGNVHGVLEDTERTYTEVMTLMEIMENNLVDWSMLGMIVSGLSMGGIKTREVE